MVLVNFGKNDELGGCRKRDENGGLIGFGQCDKMTVLVVWSISENDGFSCCGQCSKKKRLVVAVSGQNGWFGGCGGCDEIDGFSGCD